MQKLIVIAVLLASTANGQTSGVDHVLVPIYAGASGAFGSLWTAELRIMNAGPTPAAIDNLSDFTGLEGGPPLLPPQASMNASQAILDVPGGTGIPGALLLIQKSVAGQFTFQSRVRDISRDSERWGVEIPVVDEGQATTQPIDLLGVPVDPRFRLMLRVYSFDRVTGSQVHVRLFGTSTQNLAIPTTSDPLIAETVLPLTLAVTASQPSYAELPNLGSIPGIGNYAEIRVRVEPLEATRLWAMISVTNNTTQEVTIITPNSR